MNRFVWTTCAILVLAAAGLQAQDGSLEARMRKIEEENARIQRELEHSRRENAELRGVVGDLRGETDRLKEERDEAVDNFLERHINAVSEVIQDTEWSHATKTGIGLRFYGYIRMDAYWDSARATDPIIPFGVLPEGGAVRPNDAQFAFDSRLTRFGIEFDAGKIGSADVTARLETDFANFPTGSPESRETPRIRLAYINIDFGELTIRMGQDWDVISPLNPAVNYELLLWGAGNLGDRRPQAQLIWETGDPTGTTFTAELSAGMTGAIDALDLDGLGGRTNIDGFDSGHPHVQGRLAVGFNSWVTGQRAAIGVWGYWAALDTDMTFGGEDEFNPFAVGIDLNLPIVNRVKLVGEAWYGQALSDIRGNILQNINRTTGDEIAGWGGWVEVHWQVTDTFRLAFGGSIDDPDEDDLAAGVSGQDRNLNWTTYVSSKLDLGGGLSTGLDVIYWETQYLGTGLGNMVRVNYWIQLNF
ncbi:MAG: hypothetical protein R3F20_01725 [Planctomycetota bacterium]